MAPPVADTVLVRYGGEIGTKSGRVRYSMEKTLIENLESLLKTHDIEAEIDPVPTRPLIRTSPSDINSAAEVAANAFGVTSTSPAVSVAPEREPIISTLVDVARSTYDGGSFRVSARRAGTDYPFTSHDIEVEAGDAIWNAVANRFNPSVDLDDPDYTYSVECRPEEAFVFTDNHLGPGGLPLGTQTPVVSLISGGLDSPVAAYEVMCRGCPIRPVYLDLGDYGGPDHEARALETVNTLSRYAPNFDFSSYRVPAGDTVSYLVEKLGRGRMIVFRRYMFRVAEHIADRENAAGIVTGEAIGQKSSQTAQNLTWTSQASSLPIFRPLLTFDKDQIVARAKAIGTFHDSTIPAGCNRFAPSKPVTNCDPAWLESIEPDDVFDRAERDAANAELIQP